MKRFMPSPAMVVACAALFVALGGVSYGFATGSISGREIQNGTILSKDVRDRGLRGQELKRDSIGPNAVKEESLDSLKLGPVTNAAAAQGSAHHAVIGSGGADRPRPRRGLVRAHGHRPVPGGLRPRRAPVRLRGHARRRVGRLARHRPGLGDLAAEQRQRGARLHAGQRRGGRQPLVPSRRVLLTGLA